MNTNYLPATALLILSICLSVYASARVSEDAKQVAVLFPIHNSLQKNFDLANKADTLVVRSGGIDQVLIVEKKSPIATKKLYKVGAIAIFNPLILGNCINK
ncbi:MAG: hypothetical protein A3J37_00250 [Alphaproteobacteria bacterium RIFCSPHIGHO2_12_FULL_45_9]|nr:MAG: hypothetical protein A3B66_06145 [Alphaproteobacteria bacterium RIFCSPHIGHO2_02_FULL_46_13]OFW97232.1 MAG: hypothetical protein A3J37_00250 [Alphaproteobacteria bacterium RIFCSPHIGHO2_12_FULL_45_9]